MTYVLPVSGPSGGRSSSPASKRRPRSRSSSTSARFCSSANQSTTSSARSGPKPSTSATSSGVAAISRSTVPKWPREVAREHPADPGDVQAEEDARERHLLRALDRLDRRASRRSPRSPRARAAAPSSGGRGRAASGRGPCSQRMRIVCSPTPSMSATPVQLISVSRPRDGQARFGQRCIASPSGLTISVPQSGQCVGIRNSFVPRRCGPAGPTICGMTSPARWTMTSSPCADPLAVDVLLVVQRRAGDGDAADLDRLHDRPRVERAGAARRGSGSRAAASPRSSAPTCRRAPSAGGSAGRRAAAAGRASRP